MVYDNSKLVFLDDARTREDYAREVADYEDAMREERRWCRISPHCPCFNCANGTAYHPQDVTSDAPEAA